MLDSDLANLYGVEIKTIKDVEIELEHKITLAISIRLKAEKFIINKINDPDFVNSINKYQTVKLVDKYKKISNKFST